MKEYVYARIEKERFCSIPKEYRDLVEDFSVDKDDYNELSKDELFNELYQKYSKAKKELNNYKFELRKRLTKLIK